MVKHFCDHCGRDITVSRRVIVRMEAADYYESELKIDGLGGIINDKEKELCPKCALAVRKYVVGDMS